MARTVNIFVNTKDYFAAHLDNEGVRIGLYNSVSFDLPVDHALFSEAKSCKTSDDAEIVFDKLMES